MASPSLCTHCLRRITHLRLRPSTRPSSSSFTTRTISARHNSISAASPPTSASRTSQSPLQNLASTRPSKRRTINIRSHPFTSASALRRPSPEATTTSPSSPSSGLSAPPPPPSSVQSAQQETTKPISGPGVESGARITITPRAVNRLAAIAQKQSENGNGKGESALRISVESGGCHGFQYLMNLVTLGSSPSNTSINTQTQTQTQGQPQTQPKEQDEDEEEEDTIFSGPQSVKVVMDAPSLELLNGSTVDYTMELIGSQFKVTGIPGASSSCGCGTSFDIK